MKRNRRNDRKKFLLAAMLAAAGFAGAVEPDQTACPVSPWDQGQREIVGSPALPIRYSTPFTREREMLGYRPRFLPGMLTFTPGNRPVMRIGVSDASKRGQNKHTVAPRDAGSVNLIQFLGDDGRWHVTDGHVRAVARQLGLPEDAPLPVLFGERTPDAVEFDPAGGAYTLVLSNAAVNGKTILRRHLVYSPDGFRTFQAIPVPYNEARLEPWRPNADRKTPWLLARDGASNYFVVPVIAENGKVRLGDAVKVIDAAWKPLANLAPMSGDGAMMISRGNKSFIVFMAQRGIPDDPGSPHYIVEYDHASGRVSEPRFLAVTGTRIDGHNVPVIDADSKGRLHVVCGAHWHSFMYLRSKAPINIAAGFEAPQGIGAATDTRWSRDGLSYPAFAIDAADRMVLVARGRTTTLQKIDRGGPYDTSHQDTYINYALVCFFGTADGHWGARQDVVIPGYNPYSNWYQKGTLDRKGNFYLLYYYYAARLEHSPKVLAEYRKRWPEEADPEKDPRAHDPVIAVCLKGRWRIALSPWFRHEMAERQAPKGK